MTVSISESATWTAPVTGPSAGEYLIASNTIASLQALANRTKLIDSTLGLAAGTVGTGVTRIRQVASSAALKTVTSPIDGDVAIVNVPGAPTGTYVFRAGSSQADAAPWAYASTSVLGCWFPELSGVLAGGIAGGAGSKLAQVDGSTGRLELSALPSLTPVGFQAGTFSGNTSSTSSGALATFTVAISSGSPPQNGDILEFEYVCGVSGAGAGSGPQLSWKLDVQGGVPLATGWLVACPSTGTVADIGWATLSGVTASSWSLIPWGNSPSGTLVSFSGRYKARLYRP